MRIAVIGGIGSGKSEVLETARGMGLKTASADEINAGLLTEGDYIAKIAAAFPNVVRDGRVDKNALSDEIFSDRKKRKKLNAIAHPEILKRIRAIGAEDILVELPLGAEAGMLEDFDEVIHVYAPRRLRLKRLEQRGVDRKRALRIMRAQARAGRLERSATRTIANNGSIDELRSAAETLFKLLCL